MIKTRDCETCGHDIVKYVELVDMYLCKKCIIDAIELLIVQGGLVEDVRLLKEIDERVL